MSFLSLLTVPCTLHLEAGSSTEDEHGNPIPDTPTDKATVCFVGQHSASETGAEETGTMSFLLFLKPDEPVTGWSKVTVQGVEWEIDGQPWHVVRGLTGEIHHVEANLRRTA